MVTDAASMRPMGSVQFYLVDTSMGTRCRPGPRARRDRRDGHLRRGETAEAADAYRAALRWDPSPSRAAFYLAVARVRDDDLEGARDALLQAREFAPGDAEIAELLGRVEAAPGG